MLVRYCWPGFLGLGRHGSHRGLHVVHGRQRHAFSTVVDLYLYGAFPE